MEACWLLVICLFSVVLSLHVRSHPVQFLWVRAMPDVACIHVCHPTIKTPNMLSCWEWLMCTLPLIPHGCRWLAAAHRTHPPTTRLGSLQRQCMATIPKHLLVSPLRTLLEGILHGAMLSA